MRKTRTVEPQPGPQTQFFATDADIVVYGGSAGGGKSWSLIIEALRHVSNPGFGAVIFRRTLKQVKKEGGLWDECSQWYPLCGARPNLNDLAWQFPSGAKVTFGHLEHEKNKYDWQGSQIPYIAFDELTHFTDTQFFYMLSRSRSLCGVRPYIRATCNPGPGWVKRLLAPWVDRKFPGTPAKSGEIRYFKRENNQIVWIDKPPKRVTCGCLKEECENCFPPEKSITFIRATVYDNKILLGKDPGYLTNLKALHDEDRKQLLHGDWDVRPAHRVISTFDENVHVLPWRSTDGWIRAVGLDFGDTNTAFLIVAEDPVNKILYVIAEYWPGVVCSTKHYADKIRELAGGTPQRGAGGNKTNEQGWRNDFIKEGIPVAKPEFRDVTIKYQRVRDEFAANRLFVFDNCPVLIGMLNNFAKDTGPDGEVLDTYDDAPFHLCAALREIVMLLRPPGSAFERAMAQLKAMHPLEKEEDG